MDQISLAQAIKLSPRAVVLRGTPFERKKGGTLSAVIPHYATGGNPLVAFDSATGEPRDILGHGAEIEFNFKENDPAVQFLNARHFSNHILVQLMYGTKNESPSSNACKILKEVGSKIIRIAEAKKEILLAGTFIMKVSGGSSDTVFVPFGAFTLEGAPIWINPESIEHNLLSTDFPADQTHKNLKEVIHWYEQTREALRHIFKGDELHNRVLESRVGFLIESGAAKTKKEALALATADAEAFLSKSQGAAATPAASTKQTPARDFSIKSRKAK